MDLEQFTVSPLVDTAEQAGLGGRTTTTGLLC